MVYKECLLQEGIELYGNNYENFDIQDKLDTEIETNKFDEWRKKIKNNRKFTRSK